MGSVTPFLWFLGDAEEAMRFYIDTFPDSRINHIERYSGDQGIPGEDELKGRVLTGEFEVCGQAMSCLDGPKVFDAPGPAVSLMVEFEDQAQLDAVWDRLADGGTPMQCGWITDRFGITWQIVPASLGRMMRDPGTTPAQKQALMQAMMPMVKLDGPTLEKAYDTTA